VCYIGREFEFVLSVECGRKAGSKAQRDLTEIKALAADLRERPKRVQK
jgi:hypothetical protein